VCFEKISQFYPLFSRHAGGFNWAVAKQTLSFQTHKENFRTFLVVSREDDDDDDE